VGVIVGPYDMMLPTSASASTVFSVQEKSQKLLPFRIRCLATETFSFFFLLLPLHSCKYSIYFLIRDDCRRHYCNRYHRNCNHRHNFITLSLSSSIVVIIVIFFNITKTFVYFLSYRFSAISIILFLFLFLFIDFLLRILFHHHIQKMLMIIVAIDRLHH